MLALLAAAIIWQPDEASARPRLRLSPNAGPAAVAVRVRGSGFVPNATGFIMFGRRRVAAIRTNRHGGFAMRLVVPSTAPGRTRVTAVVRVGRKRIPGTKRFRARSPQLAIAYFGVRLPRSPSPSPSPSPAPWPSLAPWPSPLPAPVLMAAGDLVTSATNRDAIAVRDAVSARAPTRVLMLGDYQYTFGSLSAILGGADRIWGAKPGGLWSIMRPTAGPMHDIANCAGSDYKAYWDVGGMQPYSFDLGTWHLISLPSAAFSYKCDTAGILSWLTQDLAAHPNACTLAFWHEPYWTRPTSVHRRTTAVKPWVQALYDAGGDVILSAHQHDYQRFAPQDPSDRVDAARGIREFVVGTGGAGLYRFTGSAANVEASDATTYGALSLTLRPTGYDWSFVAAAGGSFTDSGSGDCH